MPGVLGVIDTVPDSRVAGRLARWRGGRLLHPRGLSFTGEVELWGPLADRMAGGAGNCAGTVRLSRGTPTPDGWPDVLGLALRLHGRAGPFDLLLSTSSLRRVLRHVPIPRYDFAGPYSSLLAYRIDNRRMYVAARSIRPLGRTLDEVASAADRDAACLDLLAVGATGPWRRFGRVVFGARLPAEVDAALAFDPDGSPGSPLRPTGLIQRLRGASYPFSQRSRGAAADQTRLP